MSINTYVCIYVYLCTNGYTVYVYTYIYIHVKRKQQAKITLVYIVTWECSSLFAMSLRISLCIHVGVCVCMYYTNNSVLQVNL